MYLISECLRRDRDFWKCLQLLGYNQNDLGRPDAFQNGQDNFKVRNKVHNYYLRFKINHPEKIRITCCL